MSKKVKRIICMVLILAWMIAVFSLSNQDSTESGSLSQKIASYVPCYEGNEEVVEHVVRKDAHLTEYAVGGVLFILLFMTYDFSENKRMLYAEIVGIEYAIIDEIHQLFVDGRACRALDVCIDSIGVGLGICFTILICKIFNGIKEKKNKKS